MSKEADRVLPHIRTPSPRNLMRARHPDLFSDTEAQEIPRFSRSLFEYHLDTLTSRKQEYEFEHFCRRLAEKEICPNLRPQTGPTGGGDSKVDSETYPVSEQIAERWWVGSPSAASERWAFAFSTKKAWKPKAKADVASIVATGRDYRRIYFVTNQFVSDKIRATTEDQLSKNGGIPVHILDRTWLVEKVLTGRHFDLAITTLHIDGHGIENARRAGPRDTIRLQELEDIDKQVVDTNRYHGARFQLVEDCLRGALLARSLERPRFEIESRFAHTANLAAQLNYQQQLLRIAYNRAWTSFWWFEDYASFNRYYDEVEQYAVGSIEAGEIELLVNLWQLLPPSVEHGHMSLEGSKLDQRREKITNLLTPIAENPSRPNNALKARTSLLWIHIVSDLREGRATQVDERLGQLSRLVDESLHLGDYPFIQLSRLLREVGTAFDGPAFDSLYEKVANVLRQRTSDGEAGIAFVERGFQKIDQGRPYEAIGWFGRAIDLLIKEEYRSELVAALAGISSAYERGGLLWSARNSLLAAIERTIAAFNQLGSMPLVALALAQRLTWIEIQLGRFPHVLSAMGLANFVARHLVLTEEKRTRYEEDVIIQEAVFGIYFLRLSFEALPKVARLPDALGRVGLTNARVALLHALGQDEAIQLDGYFPKDKKAESISRFFEKWRCQPAADDLADHLILVDGEFSTLRSKILGAEIIVETPNNGVSFGIAEALLGALESLLATSGDGGVLVYREKVTILIKPSTQISALPELQASEGYGATFEVLHPVELLFSDAADRVAYLTWLRESIFTIIERMLVISDISAWLKKISEDERGFACSITFGDVCGLNRDVFGRDLRFTLSDWIEPTDRHFLVSRRPSGDEAGPMGDVHRLHEFGNEKPQFELPDRTQLKHSEHKILSPIDLRLWDQAKWRGIGFIVPREPYAPILTIAFERGQFGDQIFREWQQQFGAEDRDDSLRVAFVTGLSRQSPSHYAAIIGPNFDRQKAGSGKVITLVSRILRMTPDSSNNLTTFLEAYRITGRYALRSASVATALDLAPTPSLAKRHLHVRPAWQLGANDPDAMALLSEDDPIVPPDVQNPPVLEALKQMRSLRASKGPVS